MLVVDTALVVEFALDRLGEQARLSFVGEQELVTPCLLWSEVPSAINEMAFRGELPHALATRAIERFLAGKLHVGGLATPSLRALRAARHSAAASFCSWCRSSSSVHKTSQFR